MMRILLLTLVLLLAGGVFALRVKQSTLKGTQAVPLARPAERFRLHAPQVQLSASSDGANPSRLSTAPATGEAVELEEDAPQPAADFRVPLSIEDPQGFEQAMSSLYRGESRAVLESAFANLRSSMPDRLGHDVHMQKALAGNCVVVGQKKTLSNGAKQYTVPREFQRNRKLYLDQIQGLPDGSVVTTRIELGEIAPYADTVAEINWPREAIKDPKRR